MEDEKQKATSPEASFINVEGYVYQVRRGDIGSRIRISKDDYLTLKVYRENKRKPIPTVLHCMIGQAAKCWEEDHASKIHLLEEELEGWKRAALLYLRKYGKLKEPPPPRKYA